MFLFTGFFPSESHAHGLPVPRSQVFVCVFQTEELNVSRWAKKPSVIAVLCRRLRRSYYQ